MGMLQLDVRVLSEVRQLIAMELELGPIGMRKRHARLGAGFKLSLQRLH